MDDTSPARPETGAPITLEKFPAFLRAKAMEKKDLLCIVDGAADETLFPLLKNSNWEYRCLFKKGVHYEGERLLDTLAATAPFLVLLDPDKVPVELLVRQRLGRHSMIFLRSQAPLRELAEHFSGMLKSMDERGNLFNFRYFDPRILRVYLPTCTEEEKQIFYGPADTFWAEDGEGAVLEFPRTIETPPEKKEPPAPQAPQQPKGEFGIFSAPKKTEPVKDDSLTGFGIFG